MLAGGIGMTLDEAAKEFELDCKIRHLSPKTIDNYGKQLRYKYFRCPKCRVLMRTARGGGEKEMHCPQCHTSLKVKS